MVNICKQVHHPWSTNWCWSTLKVSAIGSGVQAAHQPSWDGPPRTRGPAHPRLHLPPLTTKVMMVWHRNPEGFLGTSKTGRDKWESTLQGYSQAQAGPHCREAGGSLTDILHLQSLSTELFEERLFYYWFTLSSSSLKKFSLLKNQRHLLLRSSSNKT